MSQSAEGPWSAAADFGEPALLLDSVGRISEATPSTAVLTGYPMKDILYRSAHDFFPSLAPAGVLTAVIALPEGSEVLLEGEVELKSGTRRPVRLKVSSRPRREGILLRVGHHRRAEDHLVEEAAFARALLATCNEAVLVLNGSNQIVLASRAFEKLAGTPYTELRGRAPWDFLVDEDESGGAQSQVSEVHSTGVPVTRNWTWRTKSGRPRRMVWQLSPLCIPRRSKTFVLAVGSDFPEPYPNAPNTPPSPMDTGAAMGRIRSILDFLPALISYINLDGTYAFANRSYEDCFGVPVDRIEGGSVKDLVPPEVFASIRPRLECALQGERVSFELAVPRPEGGKRCLQAVYIPDKDLAGRVRGLFGQVYDITEYRNLIQELAERQAQLQSIMDQTPAVITLVDPEDRFMMVDRQFENLVTLGRDALLGKSVREVFPPAVAARISADNAAVRSSRAPREFQETFITPRGLRTFMSVKFPLFHASGSLYAVGTVSTDITERMRGELETRWLNERLEDRYRGRAEELRKALEDLHTFVYSMAHNLRAPLRTMAGFGQALREEFSGRILNDGGQDLLHRIEEAAQRMDALIQGLLDFGRLAAGKIDRRPVSLGRLLGRALGVVAQELVGRSARLTTPPAIPYVMGDEAILELVLIHLLSNAAKFVAPGVEPDIVIWSEFHDESVRLVIQDNGIGIPPEYHDRIFGVFEQLNLPEHYPGTGIGLSIVKKALDRLGGRVDFQSEPGQGSRFWIELPKATAQGPEPG